MTPNNIKLTCTILSDTIVGFDCLLDFVSENDVIEFRLSCHQLGYQEIMRASHNALIQKLFRGLVEKTKYTFVVSALVKGDVKWVGRMVVVTKKTFLDKKNLFKKYSFSKSGIHSIQTLKQSLVNATDDRLSENLSKAARIISQNPSFSSLAPTLLFPLRDQSNRSFEPFSSDLDFVLAVQSNNPKIPIVLSLLCDKLSVSVTNGIHVKHVFRTIGNKLLVASLQNLSLLTTADDDIKTSVLTYKNKVEILLEVFSPVDCADAIKSYLRLLPTPLIDDVGVVSIQDVVHSIPISHRYCLFSVCELLQKVSKQPFCGVDVATLSSVFAVIFFKSDDCCVDSNNLNKYKTILESRAAIVSKFIENPTLLQIPTAPLPDENIVMYN